MQLTQIKQLTGIHRRAGVYVGTRSNHIEDVAEQRLFRGIHKPGVDDVHVGQQGRIARAATQ